MKTSPKTKANMHYKDTFASSNPKDSVISASDICITKVLMLVNAPIDQH
jgi:hypothetical protein